MDLSKIIGGLPVRSLSAQGVTGAGGYYLAQYLKAQGVVISAHVECGSAVASFVAQCGDLNHDQLCFMITVAVMLLVGHVVPDSVKDRAKAIDDKVKEYAGLVPRVESRYPDKDAKNKPAG